MDGPPFVYYRLEEVVSEFGFIQGGHIDFQGHGIYLVDIKD